MNLILLLLIINGRTITVNKFVSFRSSGRPRRLDAKLARKLLVTQNSLQRVRVRNMMSSQRRGWGESNGMFGQTLQTVHFSHGDGAATLMFCSSLDQDPSDESWGVNPSVSGCPKLSREIYCYVFILIYIISFS